MKYNLSKSRDWLVKYIKEDHDLETLRSIAMDLAVFASDEVIENIFYDEMESDGQFPCECPDCTKSERDGWGGRKSKSSRCWDCLVAGCSKGSAQCTEKSE